MLKKQFLIWAAISFSTFVNAQEQTYPANDASISFRGRTILDRNGKIELISSASSVGFQFRGDSCTVVLQNIASPGNYKYVALEIDGVYAGRLRVDGNVPRNFLHTTHKQYKNRIHRKQHNLRDGK